MRLSEELLGKAEDFFDLIANEDECVDLDLAMDSLRRLLEHEIDGWTHTSDEKLAFSAQNRLEEIWSLIPKTEKKADDFLEDHYCEMLEELQKISGFEADFEKEES